MSTDRPWNNDPLSRLFGDELHRALSDHVSSTVDVKLHVYVTNLLVRFAHTDRIFSIRDTSGRRLKSIAEMIDEGDVLLKAPNFEREREVHKHLGDYILFWSGINPQFLGHAKLRSPEGIPVPISAQGRDSYYRVSTFDYSPYEDEAKLYRQLSSQFDELAFCLTVVRDRLGILQYRA